MTDFQDCSTVVSLVPVAINETKPGLVPGSYHIPAVAEPLTNCNVLIVARARFAVYIDESRPALVVPEPSDRVATSICRDLKVSWGHYTPDVSEPGLFWLPGVYSREQILRGEGAPKGTDVLAILEKARAMQKAWFLALVNEADDYWSRHRARRMVSDLQRAAARALGLKKEWDLYNEVTTALSVCKYCRGEVHPDAIICKHCEGVLNIERFNKEFVKSGAVVKAAV